MNRIGFFSVVGLTCVLSGCTSQQTRSAYMNDIDEGKVKMVLSSWHLAAENGLFDFYFDQMTDDSIFLGTDASERWTKDEFMGYAREPFSDGNGWTYKQIETHIAFDDDYNTAWVDEILVNEKYGTLRGTAVLRRESKSWKIAHYSLTFLVPNDKAKDVVELIQAD
jgi:ketosteroid isomerase-like protein